jgi:hypothetical protein
MHVAVDTNALRAAGLESPAMRSLASYLSRTRSTLLLPSVVVEELCASRLTELQELQRSLASVAKDLLRLAPCSAFAPPPIDKDELVAEYHGKLLELAAEVQVLENKEEDLSELVRRLANRIRPASEGGEEARDVLLWLSVRRVAREQHVTLISSDHKAFYKSKDSVELHPTLVTDLGEHADNVSAYSSVDSFLRANNERSSFVDADWVTARFDEEVVREAIDIFINGNEYVLENEFRDKGEPSGYTSLIQIVQHEVKDFFVSDVNPEELYVSAVVWAELEVEVEYYASRRIERDWHARDPEEYRREFLDSLDALREERRAAYVECVYPCVEIHLQLEIAVRTEEIGNATISMIETA